MTVAAAAPAAIRRQSRVLPVIVGLAAFAYFAWLATPGLTFVGVDHDISDTLWAGKVWGLQHPTGSPVYTSVSWVVARFTPTWDAEAHWLEIGRAHV